MDNDIYAVLIAIPIIVMFASAIWFILMSNRGEQ